MTLVRKVQFAEVGARTPAPAASDAQPWQAQPLSVPQARAAVFPDRDQRDVPEDQGVPQPHRRELEQARAECQQQCEELRLEAQQQGHSEGFQAGKAEGRELGLAEGRAAAQAELDQVRTELQSALAALIEARQRMLLDLELDLSELVILLAGELAGGAVEAEPERVVELARQALALLTEGEVITLRAAPGPAAVLRQAEETLAATVAGASLRIIDDGSLSPEGCLVECELGRVDQQVQQRLKAARDLVRFVRQED
jgi:flagellar assembly protein FliH